MVIPPLIVFGRVVARRYFRRLLIGYVVGLESVRAIARRAANSLTSR